MILCQILNYGLMIDSPYIDEFLESVWDELFDVRSKLRENAMQKLSKYQSKNNAHANVAEFEADRYAANKAGSKNIKKGIREAYIPGKSVM